jgi:hypothetical protein
VAHLLPSDFIDRQSFVLPRPATAIGPRDRLSRLPAELPDHGQSFMGPHFEGIEMQHERRQREPQIIQFFGPGVIRVIHGEFCLWFEASGVD